MENRFGLKDGIIVTLLSLCVVLLIAGMFQINHFWSQWSNLNDNYGRMNDNMKLINQKLAKLERQGIAIGEPGAVGSKWSDVEAFQPYLEAEQAEDYMPGGWLVDAFASNIDKLTPLTASDVYQSEIESHVLESLAVRDQNTLEWQPLVAETWTISDDGLTFDFTLRQDVNFSDGAPLTAEDVVFTFDWIMNPKIDANRSRAYFSRIDSVEKLDDYKVRFRLKEPYFLGFQICAGMPIMAKHWYGQFSEDEFNATPGLLFGSGPYRLQVDPLEWRSGGNTLMLVQNDKYWGPKPAFDRLVYRIITDPTARLAAFGNGEIDIFRPNPDEYVKTRDRENIKELANVFVFETVTGGYRYVAWNQRKNGEPTPFADKRVRQAMTYLINRQLYVDKFGQGLSRVTTGPFHYLNEQQYNADIEPREFDLEKGKALLAEAGFKDRDGDGVVEDPQGNRLEFDLIYPSSSDEYSKMVQFFSDTLRRAGVIMKPEPLEWTIMLQRINSRDFDAMTLGWGGTVESDPYQIFHSDNIADGADNYVHYTNPTLDLLIEKARVEPDKDKRQQLWHQVHAILYEDQPYTFIQTRKAVTYVNKRIANVEVTKVGLNDRKEWYIPLEHDRRK